MSGLILTLVITNELFPAVSLVGRFACENLLWIGYYVLGYVIVNTPVDLNKRHFGFILLTGLVVLYIIGIGDILMFKDGSGIKQIIRIGEAIMVFLLLSKANYKKLERSRLVGGGHKNYFRNKLRDVPNAFLVHITHPQRPVC